MQLTMPSLVERCSAEFAASRTIALGPVPDKCNNSIPVINVPYLVIYPLNKAHLSLE